jgi:protein SCO1/2
MKTLRIVRLATWAAIAVLVVLAGLLFYQRQTGQSAVTGITAASIGGPFTLTDQHGNTVTEAALKGHPSALFFGYTFCPDVCPTTLSDMTTWLQKLGPDADRLKVYFITVDPERDTQAAMAEYLQAFDPRIVGLTGSRAAIDQILKDYRVYSRKVPLDGGSYSMDHSASIYLLNADAVFTSTVDYQEDTDTVLKKLKRLVAAS